MLRQCFNHFCFLSNFCFSLYVVYKLPCQIFLFLHLLVYWQKYIRIQMNTPHDIEVWGPSAERPQSQGLGSAPSWHMDVHQPRLLHQVFIQNWISRPALSCLPAGWTKCEIITTCVFPSKNSYLQHGINIIDLIFNYNFDRIILWLLTCHPDLHNEGTGGWLLAGKCLFGNLPCPAQKS